MPRIAVVPAVDDSLGTYRAKRDFTKTSELLHKAMESGATPVKTAREHLSFRRTDPWSAYWKSTQTIDRSIKRPTPAAR